MRFYSFTNLYTAGIHAGIQTAHAVHEMMHKYNGRGGMKAETLYEWAENHKTIIVLQAGYHEALNSLYDELKPISAELELPIIKWNESKAALNGATTAVGIVVPAHVYNRPTLAFATNGLGESVPVGIPTPGDYLADIIRRYRMAI